MAKEKFGKSVLALAVRWILDRGDTVALWGARKPSQLDAIDEVMGWHIDDATMDEIDHVVDSLAEVFKSLNSITAYRPDSAKKG